MQTIIGVAVVALALATLAAPVGAQSGVADAGDALTKPSGFLPGYSLLKPVPDKEGRFVWLAPDAELRGYRSFILPPLAIWIDADAQYRGLSADVVQRLATIYQTAFAGVLAPDYPIVEQAGPGVAVCRFAITGVTPEKPGFRPRDVVPVALAFHAIRAASGTSAKVARVSGEIVCEDSMTQKMLLEAVVTNTGRKQFTEGQPILWSDVEPVLAGWAQDFKDRLNALQSR